MATHKNILEVIGNTPIVRLNTVIQSPMVDNIGAEFYAKLEFTNPGGSIKDRIGYWLIDDAEKKGLIKPGGTIVEGTSGNTGVGLAIASAIKGYKCIFVLPDKMSQEKIRNLRAFGAKVVVTPTAVEPEDPRSYYQVSRRLARETPNAIYLNQYDNLANREAHYKTTGPEILKQFPDVDVIVAGIGTGGTVCGIGMYMKEHKPSVKVIAVDPIGSIVYDNFKTGKFETHAKPYKIEGIGEDFIPKNYDYSVIHDMVQVEDKESFLMTRELLVKEGIYSGISSGSAVVGAMKWVKSQGASMKGKKILVILPDSGNRYLSKAYDDDWMREAGFLETGTLGTVEDLLRIKPAQALIQAKTTDKISSVIELMHEKGISQVPVLDAQGWVKGIANEASLLAALYEGNLKASDNIDAKIDSSIEFVKMSDAIEKITKIVTDGKTPLVEDSENSGKITAIITKIDLLSYIGNKS